jgi:hypothetical protein
MGAGVFNPKQLQLRMETPNRDQLLSRAELLRGRWVKVVM